MKIFILITEKIEFTRRKQHMKKFFAILLALAMLLSLAACGNSAPAPTEAPAVNNEAEVPAVPETEAPAKTVKVGISLALTDDFTENLRVLEEAEAAAPL